MLVSTETSQGLPLRMSIPDLITAGQSFFRAEFIRPVLAPAAVIEESLLTFLGLLSYERVRFSRYCRA